MPFSASVLCEVVEEMASLCNFYAMTCFSYCHATKLLDLLTRPQRFPRKEGRACEISFYFRYLLGFLRKPGRSKYYLALSPVGVYGETACKYARNWVQGNKIQTKMASEPRISICCDLQNAECLICEENLTVASKYTRILILAEIYREKMENPTAKTTECMQTTLLTTAASTVRY